MSLSIRHAATARAALYQTINEIEPAAWDALFPADSFARHRWCRLLETVLADFEPRYILLRQDGQPVAGAVCHVQRRFHLSVYLKQPLLRRAAGQLLQRMPPLTCGTPIFGAVGWSSAAGAAGEQALFEAFHQTAGRALFTGVDNLPGKPPLLAEAGYTFMPLPPEAVLELTAPDYDAYEQALPKKKRAEIRRVRNRAAEAGVTLSIEAFDPRYSARVEQLIRGTAEAHDNPYPYRDGLLPRAMTVVTPANTRLVLAWQNGEIVGAVTVFRSGDAGILKWVGLDYARTRDSYAYHAMMTETVRAALALGVRRFVLGATVYPLKKQMGAQLEERFVALRLKAAPLNGVLRRALAWRQASAARGGAAE